MLSEWTHVGSCVDNRGKSDLCVRVWVSGIFIKHKIYPGPFVFFSNGMIKVKILSAATSPLNIHLIEEV